MLQDRAAQGGGIRGVTSPRAVPIAYADQETDPGRNPSEGPFEVKLEHDHLPKQPYGNNDNAITLCHDWFRCVRNST